VWRDSQTLCLCIHTQSITAGDCNEGFPYILYSFVLYKLIIDSALYAMLADYSVLPRVVRYVYCVVCVYYTGIV
jgi:hypothetical protein